MRAFIAKFYHKGKKYKAGSLKPRRFSGIFFKVGIINNTSLIFAVRPPDTPPIVRMEICMFKYEIHLHSSACSACAVSTAEEMVAAAKEKNYAGVAFTNHFYCGNTAVDRKLSWREFVEAYEQDYLRAAKVGKALDIDVFFGIETVYEPGKEALIYGIEPELIKNAPFLKGCGIEQLSEFVRKNGGFIAAAHPLRRRDYIPDPDKEPDMRYFDAIEAYNLGNTDEDNQRAFDFARRKKVPVISSGDVHNKENLGKSGLAFFERLYTPERLVEALKKQRYRLIIDGKIIEDLP